MSKKKSEISEEERAKIHEELKDQYEYTFDMDKLKPQKHIWIDRGAKMTCEKAGHPYHEAWKR